jgi:putative AdoMet-dependent methyltransferase
MTPEEEDKTWNFDSWASRYDVIVAADTETYFARYDAVLDAVVEMAHPAPGERVLDIGTGTGNLALRCLSHDVEVIGLDPSELMLRRAQEKAGPNPRVAFQQVGEPFLCIPCPESTFDAVVSTYAYHHVPHRDRAASVREMVRVLKPGGRWVLGDLVFENEEAENRALQAYDWLEEEYFARIDELQEAFADLGMELKARQFTPVTWVLWAGGGWNH